MDEKIEGRAHRGRFVLVAIGLAALAALVGLPLLRDHLARDLCPATVTARGTSDGAAWDIARSDCGGGRVVWQLRIVPSKGVSTLVYEAEGGPEPHGWTQVGFVGTLQLASPLDGESLAAYAVPLDVKGRPLAAIRARDGRRLPTPPK